MGVVVPAGHVHVLAVLPSEPDRVALRRIFSRCNWGLGFASDLDEARPKLADRDTGVVLSDCVLPRQRTWKDLLDELQKRDFPPPLIVTSSLADDFLWAEVLNLGGYDLLVKPFDGQEVSRVVSLAWRGWTERVRRFSVAAVGHRALGIARSA